MSAEVHETAEISPLPSEEWIHTRPERRTGPYMHAEMHALARVPTKRLCTTHDRELAPPSAPVGQSSLLTHTRPWSRSHTHALPPILYSYVHMAHRRDEKSGYVSVPFDSLLYWPMSRNQIGLRFYRSLIECVCVCARNFDLCVNGTRRSSKAILRRFDIGSKVKERSWNVVERGYGSSGNFRVWYHLCGTDRGMPEDRPRRTSRRRPSYPVDARDSRIIRFVNVRPFEDFILGDTCVSYF